MPVFFVNANGNLGVPVMNAAAGDMQLQGVPFPPQLIDKKTVKLRINVCTRFLPIPHHLLYVSQWPGYNLPEQQVQLRDQTPQKNLISFEKFVKHVGSRVRQYLSECERSFEPGQQPFNWMVGYGNITADEVMLIGLVQVSEGSWMPMLQLMERVIM
ncbi:hypothetical protein BJV77DRAFT_991161 [Russula vinacea]|nr:hypothetical protein BJV77DRAFT_991161 [Russula vinacea]